MPSLDESSCTEGDLQRPLLAAEREANPLNPLDDAAGGRIQALRRRIVSMADDDNGRNCGDGGGGDHGEGQQERRRHPSPGANNSTPGTCNEPQDDQCHPHHHRQPWYRNPHQITAMISNFSTSYNVVNISLVLPILEQIQSGGGGPADAATAATTAAASGDAIAACASSLLAGMIVGQLAGGALGDSPLLGRLGALRLVMALQIVASLASSLLGVIPGTTTTAAMGAHLGDDIFLRLAVVRFILGIGCGGVYPLAAVLSAEQDTKEEEEDAFPPPAPRNSGTTAGDDANHPVEGKDDNDDSVHRVALTFSTQGLGFVTVPIVAVILLSCTNNLNAVWRLILGFGALPGILLMVLQLRLSGQAPHYGHAQIPVEDPLPSHDRGEEDVTDSELENDSILASDADEDDRIFRGEAVQEDEIVQHHQGNGGWLQSLVHEPGLGRKVLGTAGTWFLFDVVFYGNALFQPIVVEAAFGGSSAGGSGIDLLRKTAMDSLILTSIALPGYGVAGMIIGKKTCCVTQTPRYVMLQGFASMGVLYATIGFNWSYLRGFPAMLVLLYGLTFFFANYGPNTTTFILPSILFEKEHRATWNGVSAAAGKLGALTGATLFEPAANAFGDGAVMLICAGVAIVAYLLTYCAVPSPQKEPSPPQNPNVDNPSTGEVV
jgi:MFS transporter, PHS family, inorganic phosphate transporter